MERKKNMKTVIRLLENVNSESKMSKLYGVKKNHIVPPESQ